MHVYVTLNLLPKTHYFQYRGKLLVFIWTQHPKKYLTFIKAMFVSHTLALLLSCIYLMPFLDAFIVNIFTIALFHRCHWYGYVAACTNNGILSSSSNTSHSRTLTVLILTYSCLLLSLSKHLFALALSIVMSCDSQRADQNLSFIELPFSVYIFLFSGDFSTCLLALG